jgi:P-type conjugative transfer protein TrbJ
MNHRSLKQRLKFMACTALLASSTAGVSTPAQAQWAVVDVPLTLQQLQSFLEQIEQYVMQAQQLERAVLQYENMVKNTLDLPAGLWANVGSALNGINTIIANGQSIANQANNINQAFTRMFPAYQTMRGTAVTNATFQTQYQAWSNNTRASVQTNIVTANQLLNLRSSDQSALSGLQLQAQSASGNLQAVKAAAAVASEEVLQLQQLKLLLAQHVATTSQYLADNEATREMNEAATQQALSGSTPAFGSGKSY